MTRASARNESNMASFIGFLKARASVAPRLVGEIIARAPYSARPGFALSYRRARAVRHWFEEVATPEERRNFIFDRVARVVRYASSHVPFYAAYYQECGFNPDSIKSFDDLPKIPIVTKEMLQNEDLERRSCDRNGRTLTYTGGSTGEPFKFYSDILQVGNEWAHMHHIWASLGYRQSDLLLSVALDEKKAPVFYDALRHSLVLNIHYSREELVQAFMRIPRWKRKVRFFRGYPSSFAEFLSFCDEEAPDVVGELRNTLRGSFLASEFPLPNFRRTIERVTNRPTVSWYGHSERAVLAWEKTRPFLYEPMQSYGYCETIRLEDGFISLVGTSYWNFASPLIRYQINDGVRPVEASNGILKSFEILDGRRGDFIVDKNGEHFSITHLNLSCRESTWFFVRCVQVEQRRPGSIILWVTPRRDVTVEELSRAFDFDKLNIDCEFRIIDKPIVTNSGKVPLKVSMQKNT